MTLPRLVRSGVTPKTRLRAAVSDPEAGDHLVEAEQRPVRVAEFAQSFEEARLRAERRPCSPATGSTMTAAIVVATLGEERPDGAADR